VAPGLSGGQGREKAAEGTCGKYAPFVQPIILFFFFLLFNPQEVGTMAME